MQQPADAMLHLVEHDCVQAVKQHTFLKVKKKKKKKKNRPCLAMILGSLSCFSTTFLADM